jgi:Domain of unknown function (DUF1942)
MIMRWTTTIKAASAAAGIAAVSMFTAATAVAYPNFERLGSEQQLVDAGGAVVTGWTVDDLQPSSAVIPGHPVVGTLWEADATVQAERGATAPVVADLNARAANGQTYRVIYTVPTPQGLNPAPLVPGETRIGKVYFDVTGQAPDSVVYNNGAQDLLIWTA